MNKDLIEYARINPYNPNRPFSKRHAKKLVAWAYKESEKIMIEKEGIKIND